MTRPRPLTPCAVALLGALLAWCVLAHTASAQDQPPPVPGAAAGDDPVIKAEPLRPAAAGASAQNVALENEMNPDLDAAVLRGIEWIVAQQQADGGFGDGRFGRNVAVTSLAAIALMADGSLPGRGPYGENVSRALDFVLANSTESGLIASDSSSGPMYGHGFAALFLAEVYGMTAGGGETGQSQRLHDAIVRAVRLIERTQNDEGGWRYNPVPYDADVSVTICQIMALRSARNAGIDVSKEVIDRAVEYVRRCQNPDGGFRYQSDIGPSLWPRSAAAIATFFYAGIYQDIAIDRGIAYLNREAPPLAPNPSRVHYWYGVYYTAQAMYLAGGNAWAAYWPNAREELLRLQQGDGRWRDGAVGDVYGTAMALIALQMPKRYLPIFQK